jgi:hypothetical protein
MMAETNDRPDPKLPEAVQSLIAPGPVWLCGIKWDDPLPEYGIPQRADAEAGEEVEIV